MFENPLKLFWVLFLCHSINAVQNKTIFQFYEPTEFYLPSDLENQHVEPHFITDMKKNLSNNKQQNVFREPFTISDSKCDLDLKSMTDGKKNKENWAMLMADSQIKKPYKLVEGNRILLGNKDECVSAVNYERNFSGQFCLVYFNDTKDPIEWTKLGHVWFREPYILASGCFPSSCSREYLELMLKNTKDPYAINPNQTLNEGMFEVGIMEGDCISKYTKVPFTTRNIITTSILAVLLGLAIASTTWDMFRDKKSKYGIFGNLFLAFSLATNGRYFLMSLTARGKGSSTMVNGLKSLTALYVVATHIIYTHLNGLVDTLTMGIMSQDGSKSGAMFLNNGYSSVETFLLIAGVLMVFSFLNEIRRKGAYDPISSFVKRYFRLMFPLYFMYLIRIGISEHLGTGPVYNSMNNYHKRNCLPEMVPMIFGYLNFYDFPFNICFQQTWYVFIDLQLFIASHVVLLAALWDPNKAFKLAGLLSFGGLMVDFGVTYVNDLGFIPPYDPHLKMLMLEYVVPHTRCVPWFLGMMLGFYLKQCEQKPPKLSNKIQFLGWVLYILVFSTTYIPVIAFRWGVDYHAWQAVFGAYRRLGWSFMVGWPIFMAHTGYTGFLDKILSWPPLVFYGVISYELYLIHFPIIEFLIATGTETFYLSYPRLFYMFFPIIAYSTILAIVMYLFVSIPLSIVVSKILDCFSILPLRHHWELPSKGKHEQAPDLIRTKL